MEPRVQRVLGHAAVHTDLVAAAYAESSWKKFSSALNLFEKFCIVKKVEPILPISENVLSMFINWAIMEYKMKPSTLTAYLSHLKLVHKLRKISDKSFDSFLCKTQMKGAENLNFYSDNKPAIKKVMTLPLLRIMGHEISNSSWNVTSKAAIWATYTVAFFGSFRLGELLSKNENKFNMYETLLWKDVKFIHGDSILIHNKISKTRKPGGEYISIFEFPFFSCCPVAAMKLLAKLSNATENQLQPVFKFETGKCLTKKILNSLIVSHLEPHIGNNAFFYSCKSFRAALPSALASNPHAENDRSIKHWGRWTSDAFERYTRLSHGARRKLFKKFSEALCNQ
jgi:hypothetical protein